MRVQRYEFFSTFQILSQLFLKENAKSVLLQIEITIYNKGTMIYPENFEQKIGFDKIREILQNKCLSTIGKEYVRRMKFLTRKDLIDERLQQTTEFMRIQTEGDNFPSQYFFDVRESVKRIRLEGTYLEEGELFDLRRSLETIQNVIRFLQNDELDNEGNPIIRYPALRNLAGDILAFPQLIQRIDQILDKYGKIKDTASTELLQIRRDLLSVTNSISKSLNNILRSAQQDGVVDKDVTPTLRDGRLVIPVAPALKRKIRGIVHDESASGKTVFIEPAEVVEANNRIRELESAEHREIIRILTEFATVLRPLVPQLLESYEFLGKIDFIRAKALFALETKSTRPTINAKPWLDWGAARHPLLQLSLEKHGKKVVPLDIKLTDKKRILLISGPNAGGKSVCLKTVGMLQYMLQCGLPIPVQESSQTGIFTSLFIDIGDEQSIEDELSTYSSHLLNMKYMLKFSDANSLILIDEFGGGTEPQIGGAMAEAMLKRFNEHKAFGVITTHYQNLKLYAKNHEGIINGAMLYDRHLMQPLFQLQIGNPGSSFAVEIARKIGIPQEIIEDASNIVGKEYINADKYLQDIVRDKRYWEDKRQNIHRQTKQMEDTINKYERDIISLQQERKDILNKAREEAKELLKATNAKIEGTIREIKEAQAEKEQTKSIRQQLKDFNSTIDKDKQKEDEDRIARKIAQIQARKQRKEENKNKKNAGKTASSGFGNKLSTRSAIQTALANRTFKEGDYVRLKGQTTIGEITSVEGKNAIITFGNIKTNIKTDRLEHAEAPTKTDLAPVSYLSSQTQDALHEKRLHFKQDIDVRGMRGDEAIQTITYFIDDAIQLGIPRVRILHGTGTGILRTLIRKYLDTVPQVAHFQDEHVQLGGAGITVVDFK